jgi:putative sterol carrier protein
MNTVRYCTPEWLEESAKGYQANAKYQKEFAKMTLTLCFRVKAESTWGIDEDIIFGADVEKGKLNKLVFFSEEAAKEEAEYIVAATPQEWKKILRKESKFVTDFMLGKITLEQGSKVGILGVAPHSNTFVDALTQKELNFPDEMSPDELEEYRAYMKSFRAELGV